MGKMVTINEAAKIFRTSTQNIRAFIKRHNIKTEQNKTVVMEEVTRKVRVTLVDIDALRKARNE